MKEDPARILHKGFDSFDIFRYGIPLWHAGQYQKIQQLSHHPRRHRCTLAR